MKPIYSYKHTTIQKPGNAFCFLLLAFIFLAFSSQAQQASSFTQFPNNQLPFNYAYSLVQNTGAFNSLMRKQFTGIEGAPTTFMLNGYLPIQSIGGAAGINVLNDDVAIEKLTELNAFFAKSIQLTDNQYLGVAINAGYHFYKANYSSVDPTGMDPNFRDNVEENKPNIGFSVMYYSDKYYVGLSVPKLTTRSLGNASQQNATNFKNNYYFTGAYLATMSESFKIKPAVLVNYVNGLPVTADFQATLYAIDKIGIGANYRTTGEAAGILELNVDALRIGYSYQFGTGQIAGFGNGTHEITLGIRFGQAGKTPKLL